MRVDAEIVNLFDYTFNDNAKEKLLNIFINYPASVEEIFYRQSILYSFIQNISFLESYSYSKIDFREVRAFFQTPSSSNLIACNNSISLGFKLYTSEKEMHKFRGQIVQLILLFQRINDKMFSRIRKSDFPREFGMVLERIDQIFLELNLSKFGALVKEDNLKIKDIVAFQKVLRKCIESNSVNLFWESLSEFESYLSIAIGIKKHQFVFPKFDSKFFVIKEFYHPLIKNCIKNDIDVKKNVVLLTGPNMSGKSTILRSISLCIILGHLGLGVPASSCYLPFFENISVAINLEDNIVNGYSHFMVEIQNLKRIAIEANNEKKCFAVFDEIFKSTNTQDALEITNLTIAGLSKFQNSVFFISTHLHELKNILDFDQVMPVNLECSFSEGLPYFSYKLVDGWSEVRIGKTLFEQVGLVHLLLNKS